MQPICTKPVLCLNFYMWSLIYQLVEYSLCYELVKTRSQYYFSIESSSIESYGILKTVKTSNPKAHNIEKMALKKRNHISTSFKRTFKKATNT